MYVRMYVCKYVRTYVCTYVCMYVCMCVRMYVRTYVCMYVRMCVRMYVCTYVCMYVRVCVYVCMCVCTYDHIQASSTFEAPRVYCVLQAIGTIKGRGMQKYINLVSTQTFRQHRHIYSRTRQYNEISSHENWRPCIRSHNLQVCVKYDMEVSQQEGGSKKDVT